MLRLLRFGCALLLGAALVYYSYNLISLLLDPYNVVWQARSRLYGGMALDQFRFAKTELLRRTPDRYDTIIFGNSRGSDNHTRQLSAATGRAIFNYSVSSDYPTGFLMKARWVVRTQPRLRNVVLLLWIDEFWMAGTNYGPLLAREHPAVSGESWWRYYWAFSQLPYATFSKAARFQVKHLFGLASGQAIGIVRNSGIDPASGDFAMWDLFPNLDVRGEGWPAYAKAAAADPPGTLRFRGGFMSTAEQASLAKAFATGTAIQDDQVRDFVATIGVLKHAGIRYHCVIPAMNSTTVSWIPRDAYVKWLKLVVDTCGEIWDFSKPSPVTRNNYNYLDWSHCVPDVAYAALAKVLGAKTLPAIDDAAFGTRVTSDTFAAFAGQFDGTTPQKDGLRVSGDHPMDRARPP